MAMDTTSKKLKVGMTEKQVYDIEGSPMQRSRQVVSGKTYETWGYGDWNLTLDFVDGVLTGYGLGGIYISENGREELKDLTNSK
jgi:hypothetical protein